MLSCDYGAVQLTQKLPFPENLKTCNNFLKKNDQAAQTDLPSMKV